MSSEKRQQFLNRVPSILQSIKWLTKMSFRKMTTCTT